VSLEHQRDRPRRGPERPGLAFLGLALQGRRRMDLPVPLGQAQVLLGRVLRRMDQPGLLVQEQLVVPLGLLHHQTGQLEP
jgi:hypothetical protein